MDVRCPCYEVTRVRVTCCRQGGGLGYFALVLVASHLAFRWHCLLHLVTSFSMRTFEYISMRRADDTWNFAPFRHCNPLA